MGTTSKTLSRDGVTAVSFKLIGEGEISILQSEFEV